MHKNNNQLCTLLTMEKNEIIDCCSINNSTTRQQFRFIYRISTMRVSPISIVSWIRRETLTALQNEIRDEQICQ